MISTLTQGFAVGLAYVMPIGAQNLYVINSAAKGSTKHALATALIFAAMDISLGIACIIGIGQLIQSHLLIRFAIGILGAAFLLSMGYKLAFQQTSTAASPSSALPQSILKAAFLLTWCNPHALIDGSVLLGGYQSSLTIHETYLFAAGVSLASASWFISISTIVNKFRSVITQRFMTIVNRICGLTLIIFGVRLAFSLTEF